MLDVQSLMIFSFSLVSTNSFWPVWVMVVVAVHSLWICSGTLEPEDQSPYFVEQELLADQFPEWH